MRTALLILAMLIAPAFAVNVPGPLVSSKKRAAAGGGGANITVDFWETFEFTTFNTGNLDSNDNITGGTWAIGAGTQTTSATGEQALLSTINSVSDSGHAKGMAIDISGAAQSWISYTWASSLTTTPCSFGMWIKFPTLATDDPLQVFSTVGGGDYVCRVAVYNSTGSGTRFFRLRGNGSWSDHAGACTEGNWYWISVLAQASNTCRLRVYTSVGVEIGSEVTVTAADSSQLLMRIGSDAAYTSGTGSCYWDDVIADKTDATYPLGP